MTVHASTGGCMFKNFCWTLEAIEEWEAVWTALWRLGVKWEWQNGDRYARRRGDVFNVFVVHNDAARLDMALPLPGAKAIDNMSNWLLGAHIDDHHSTTAATLLRKWVKNHA